MMFADRALQQFAQESVQGNSISTASTAANTSQDGSLVRIEVELGYIIVHSKA